MLTVELVPQTCFFSNVRSEVSALEWNKIKKIVSAKAGARCEICGGVGKKWPVECHEIWDYDDANLIQRLVGMIALCPPCHQVKHFGFAQLRGEGPQALKHLMKVNSWDKPFAEEYLAEQFKLWSERSKHEWKLDITLLGQEFGIWFGNG